MPKSYVVSMKDFCIMNFGAVRCELFHKSEKFFLYLLATMRSSRSRVRPEVSVDRSFIAKDSVLYCGADGFLDSYALRHREP